MLGDHQNKLLADIKHTIYLHSNDYIHVYLQYLFIDIYIYTFFLGGGGGGHIWTLFTPIGS